MFEKFKEYIVDLNADCKCGCQDLKRFHNIYRFPNGMGASVVGNPKRPGFAEGGYRALVIRFDGDRYQKAVGIPFDSNPVECGGWDEVVSVLERTFALRSSPLVMGDALLRVDVILCYTVADAPPVGDRREDLQGAMADDVVPYPVDDHMEHEYRVVHRVGRHVVLDPRLPSQVDHAEHYALVADLDERFDMAYEIRTVLEALLRGRPHDIVDEPLQIRFRDPSRDRYLHLDGVLAELVHGAMDLQVQPAALLRGIVVMVVDMDVPELVAMLVVVVIMIMMIVVVIVMVVHRRHLHRTAS